MVIQYPIYIEVPENYWTTTTTITTDENYNPNKYWHGKDGDED